MIIPFSIVAIVIIVTVIDIAAVTISGKADKRLERPDFIQLDKEE